MYNVLKLNSISNKIDDVLTADYNVTSDCASPDLILVRSTQMADFATGDKLIAVGRAGAGVNNIPFADYAKRGIVVFNTPGANANAVKELVVSALLLSCRKIYEGINWAQSLAGKGDEVKTLIEKGKSQFVGSEILGKTLGVIGLGAIGRLVAGSAAALGMKVIGYDPYFPENAALENVEIAKSPDAIYAEADFVTVHVPFTPQTKGMINKDVIAKMKDGAAVINCARGELVVNADVVEAVKSGKLSKYFTDFPTDDLLGIDNVITCPHLGASTPEAEDNCAVMAAAELKDYAENGNIKNSVNFPSLSVVKNGYRTAVLAANDDNLVSAVNAAAAELGIRALNSAAKGETRYILVDTDKPLNDAAFQKISGLSGVYKVRTIG